MLPPQDSMFPDQVEAPQTACLCGEELLREKGTAATLKCKIPTSERSPHPIMLYKKPGKGPESTNGASQAQNLQRIPTFEAWRHFWGFPLWDCTDCDLQAWLVSGALQLLCFLPPGLPAAVSSVGICEKLQLSPTLGRHQCLQLFSI